LDQEKIVRRIGKSSGVVVDINSHGRVKYIFAHGLRRSFGTRWAKRIIMPPVRMEEMVRHEEIKRPQNRNTT
jgi:hypothetical protein